MFHKFGLFFLSSRYVDVSSPSVSSHNGPREEWVQHTYSPSASPNSSILKRKIDVSLVSPESSPPSLKVPNQVKKNYT